MTARTTMAERKMLLSIRRMTAGGPQAPMSDALRAAQAKSLRSGHRGLWTSRSQLLAGSV